MADTIKTTITLILETGKSEPSSQSTRDCERQDTAFTRTDETIQCGVDLESVVA